MAKKADWPRRGELVIATVTKVNPFSAMVKLEEYNKEGMIHISEVARRWVGDIKKIVHVGDKLVVSVIRIDESTKQINLSLKKVNKYDAEEKMKEYKRDQKAEKMLRLASKKLGITFEQAYKDLGYKLQESFGELFKPFQLASTDGAKVFTEIGIGQKEADVLAAIAKEQLEAKEQKIKKTIAVRCLKPDGVNVIRTVLTEAKKKYKIDINYISAPDYSLSISTKNAKEGGKLLNEATKEIEQKMVALGGECEAKGE